MSWSGGRRTCRKAALSGYSPFLSECLTVILNLWGLAACTGG